MKSFVEDANDIVVEDNIVQNVSLLGAVKGTIVYLVNTPTIGIQKLTNKQFFDVRIKIRSIHDIIWNDEKVTVTKNSGVTDGSVVGKEKLDRHTNYDLNIGVII